MSEILRATELRKSYYQGGRELPVLQGVSLSLERGEMVAVVGTSGAGKSTLLHLLGALDVPTSGEVFLDGTNIYQLRERQRARVRNERIGFVFQFYHLLPEFTARENCLLPLIVGGGKQLVRGRERVEELLAEVGLEGRTEHRPSQLSGGEQQRVAIARALINEPEVILADEPTGNLDEANTEAVFSLLEKLGREGKRTIVIATHEEALARRTQRVFRLAGGEIREDRP